MHTFDHLFHFVEASGETCGYHEQRKCIFVIMGLCISRLVNDVICVVFPNANDMTAFDKLYLYGPSVYKLSAII